jgi:hypothetical protein
VRRLPAILLLTCATVGLLAGCGDDGNNAADSGTPTTAASGSVDQAQLDTLVAALSGKDGPGISKADARCVGNAVLPKLSAKARQAIVKEDESDFSDLTKAEQDAVIAGFDGCVDTTDIAAAVATGAAEGDDALSPEATDCITSKIVDRYPHSGELMRAIFSDSTSSFEQIVTGCIPATDVRQQLFDEFKDQGLTDEQAGCIADRLSTKLSADDLAAAGSGSMPASMEQQITEATQGCMTGSGG